MNNHDAFEKWIKSYTTGLVMDGFPNQGVDREKEIYFKIDGLQYRIQIKDIPQRFLQ